jgi:hypothetical protein
LDLGLASWLVIAIALAFANLPYLNERILGVLPLPGGRERKHFVVRLFEMLFLYVLLGALAYLLESRIGNVFPQTWEFYAITACLFIVLAFPGFVLRYLRRRRA